MKWQATAPSNIALIKYMGKIPGSGNKPINSSLSLCLGHLTSLVELEETVSEDSWEALGSDYPLNMRPSGVTKFLNHLGFIKGKFDINKNFIVRSKNNFPADCGIASSASSFAALTKCAVAAFSQINGIVAPDIKLQGAWSAAGSGSSCRSLIDGWVLWGPQGIRSQQFPLEDIIHQVVIVEDAKKLVSSSQAHLRVVTSSLYQGRVKRAEQRLKDLSLAFLENDWKQAFEITWAEFWDMHALFETSTPPFGYFHPSSIEILQTVRDVWKNSEGPIVTMDAGANVHLLWKTSQKELALKTENYFKKKFKVLGNIGV